MRFGGVVVGVNTFVSGVAEADGVVDETTVDVGLSCTPVGVEGGVRLRCTGHHTHPSPQQAAQVPVPVVHYVL